MDHYYRAETCEASMELADLPFTDPFPDSVLWLRVKPSSRVQAVCDLALSRLPTRGAVLWTALGTATAKALLCVELVKKARGDLHQATACGYHQVVEVWKPKENAELDPIHVKKQIPTLHVLLSTEPLMTDSPSYQAPNSSSIPFHSLRSGASVRSNDSASNSATVSSEVPQPHSHVQRTRDNAFKRRKKPRKTANTTSTD